jgi:ribosomal protein L40E
VLICGDCNARNNDGERFCSNCGAYLVWQQAPAEVEEKRPAQSAAAGAGRSPAVTTAQLPVVPGSPDSLGASRPAPGNTGGPARPDNPMSGTSLAGQARTFGAAGFGATPTANLARGDAMGERQPRQSDGRPPREPEPHPRLGEAPQVPGGLACRRCGADNKPEGSFCRQCGASLREAAVVPVPPWWRQLLGRTQPAALPAGTRPSWRKQKKLSTGTVSLLTVLGLFAGVGFLGRDVIRLSVLRAVDEIRENPISAQTKTGSKSAPGREAELAFDGTVRSWASEGSANPGADYVEAGFDPPFHLTYVVITCVAPQDSVPERRPTKVEIVAARRDGTRSSLTVGITDGDGPKNFYFGADQIATVRLNILETKGPAGARVSVADVQFAGWRE